MKKLILLSLLLLLTSCGSFKDNCRLGGQTCRTLFGESDFERDSQIEDLSNRIKINEKDIVALNQIVNILKLSALNTESILLQTSMLIDNLQTQLSLLISGNGSANDTVEALQATVLNLTEELNELKSSDSSQQSQINALQNSINTVNSQIVVLKQENITQNTAINSLQSNVTILNNQNTTQQTLLNNQQTQINSFLIQLTTASGYNIVSIKDPCGNSPLVLDEVFLVLGTGEILSSFSDKASGENTRFSLMSPGSYVTTDNSKCYFTVVPDPQPGKLNQIKIINEHY